MSRLQPPVHPKNGHTVLVLVPCRVSDPRPGKQDERSLGDQLAKADAFLKANLEHPFEMKVIEGRESGENINREDYLRLIELVETGQFDMVVSEDLGRIVRRIHAHLFAEVCVDHETRLIALNDHVDTAVEGWQDRSIFSAWHHERSNRDTSNRIKRSHANRFAQGGCAQFPIFGIIKPKGSKNDAEWQKDPVAGPIYQKIYEMLDETGNYSLVADWLNEQGVAPGPMSRLSKWNGAMVARVIHNPILKGWRYRNKRKTRRSSDGCYRSVPADASETRWRHAPHLAFFEPAAWDTLIAKLDAQNAAYRRRPGSNGCVNQTRGPRKRTRFPGQMTYCGICGRMYVFGGHGQDDHLMCDGARHYNCWNGVTFDAPLATMRIVEAVYQQIESLPEFDSTFLAHINAEAERLDADRANERHLLDLAISRTEREVANLVGYIETGGDSAAVRSRIREKEQELARLRGDRVRIINTPSPRIEIPPVDELKRLARSALSELPINSWQFQQLMQRLIPKIVVFPVVPCDGGKPVCRARFRLQLGNALSHAHQREALAEPLERVLTVDLFDLPQRIAHRQNVQNLRQELTEREAARRLGITVTAAQNAAEFQRRMDELGLTDPYVSVAGPECISKFKRHLHPRYRFDPKPDAGQL